MEFKNTKVNLFGTEYKIKFIDGLISDGEGYYWGMCYHDKLEIVVSTKTNDGRERKDSEIMQTLIHELVHASLAVGAYHELNDNEPLVEWLSRCILSIQKQKLI